MTVAARQLKRSVRAAAAPLAPEGVVTAIVAVTNHQDQVDDIIVPGAFADTLRRRRPKLCWMHDWKMPLGRVLHIVELKPGDKRLPKTLPDGRAWPKEAGALIATVQFNLATQLGRDMFEHCKAWAINGEAAFSIGYKVREGMASKRSDGVRIIYGLDLFEVSLVLHGAHDMALALEVKNLELAPGLEFLDSPFGVMEVKAAESMIGSGAMVALYLDPATAEKVAQPDGNPASELHITLAFLGDGSVADSISDPQAVADQLATAIAGTGPLAGSIGGIGTFPEGESGTPVWVPVDVPGLIELRQAVVAGCEAAGFPQQSEHGYTPHVTLGYDLPGLEPVPPTDVRFDTAYLVVGGDRFPLPLRGGEQAPMEGKAAAAVREARALHAGMEGKAGVPGVADTPSDEAAVERLRESWSHGSMAAKVGWGTPGDFDRCVALATEHMGSEDAKGWCNLRHHDALGMYPATHAKLEGKSAAAAVLEAKTMFAGSAGTATLPSLAPAKKVPAKNKRPRRKTPQEGTETKMLQKMRGSYEERREALQRALDAMFREPEKGDGKQECAVWVCVDATFDDHVIVTVHKDNGEQSYQLTYKLDADGDEVALGKPVKVDLDVVVIPETDDDEPVEVDEGDAVTMRFIDPATAFLKDATKRVMAMPEGKSLDGLETPLLELLDALAVKGYDVAHAVMGDDPADTGMDDEEEDDESAYADEMKDAADADDDGDAESDDDEDGDGEQVDPSSDTVTLDPETVRAQMADLGIS